MTDKQDVKEEIGADYSCCDPSATVVEEITDDQVRENVQKSYAKLATSNRSCCGPSLTDLGYSDSELGELS